jgi:hypothetical protein
MASRGVQDEWGRRVHAEARSAAVTAQLFVSLEHVGAPMPLLRRCHGIIQDEMRHSEESREVFVLAGGTAAQLGAMWMPGEDVAPQATVPLHRALTVVVGMFCCGETVAVPLFVKMFRRARQPRAARVIRDILHDEGGHRAFGWAALKVLLARGTRADHAVATRCANTSMQAVLDAYSHATWTPQEEDRAWGLLTPREYREAAQGAVQKVMLPRFQALGLRVKAPRQRRP